MSEPATNAEGEASRPIWRRAIYPLIFLLLWILLSGKLDFFHLTVGLLTVAYVVWQEKRLPPMNPASSPPLGVLRYLRYSLWLFGQMILSALQVARAVLGPVDALSPRLIAFRRPLPTTTQAVIFGNSITLTPGTITIELEDDCYLVHALTEETARGLLEGDMDRRVAALSLGTDNGRIEVLPTPTDGSFS